MAESHSKTAVPAGSQDLLHTHGTDVQGKVQEQRKPPAGCRFGEGKHSCQREKARSGHRCPRILEQKPEPLGEGQQTVSLRDTCRLITEGGEQKAKPHILSRGSLGQETTLLRQ